MMIDKRNYKLYKGDCLNILGGLETSGVKFDAIITDPPCNISRENNFKTMGRAGIDFGEWDKEFDLIGWIKYCEPLIKKGGKWTFNRLSDTYERPKIVCGITSKGEKINGGHPTQKPIEVMEWIVNRLTNKGDLVLDPFCGSGSTGIACINKNRRFVGIELEDAYFNMANERIDNVIKG